MHAGVKVCVRVTLHVCVSHSLRSPLSLLSARVFFGFEVKTNENWITDKQTKCIFTQFPQHLTTLAAFRVGMLEVRRRTGATAVSPSWPDRTSNGRSEGSRRNGSCFHVFVVRSSCTLQFKWGLSCSLPSTSNHAFTTTRNYIRSHTNTHTLVRTRKIIRCILAPFVSSLLLSFASAYSAMAHFA